MLVIKPRIDVPCSVCGTVRPMLACHIKRGRGKFCSKACSDASRRHGSTLFCAWCDTEFYRRFGEQGDTVNSFCCIDCYTEYRDAIRVSYPKDGARHKHRVVAEFILGRELRPSEVVHHIDNNKQNCEPSNLAVFPSQSEHARCHFGVMLPEELLTFTLLEIVKRERGAA